MADVTSWNDPLVIATFCLVAATTLLAAVAALQDIIRSWIRHPALELTVRNAPPDSHKTQMRLFNAPGIPFRSVDCYYLRLLVSNKGRSRATDVQVYADRLEKRNAAGTYELVTRFLPMNLKWTNGQGRIYLSLPAGAKRHIDLAHILDPGERHLVDTEDNPALNVPTNRTLLSFDVEMQAFNLGYLAEPGHYRPTLDVISEETRQRRHVIEIDHTRAWLSDEARMFAQGVGVRLLT